MARNRNAINVREGCCRLPRLDDGWPISRKSFGFRCLRGSHFDSKTSVAGAPRPSRWAACAPGDPASIVLSFRRGIASELQRERAGFENRSTGPICRGASPNVVPSGTSILHNLTGSTTLFSHRTLLAPLAGASSLRIVNIEACAACGRSTSTAAGSRPDWAADSRRVSYIPGPGSCGSRRVVGPI